MWPRTSASSPASSPPIRTPSAPCSACSRAGSRHSARGRHGKGGGGPRARRRLRGGTDHARDGVPGRVPRGRASACHAIGPHDYHALAAVVPGLAEGGQAGPRADDRREGTAGPGGLAVAPARYSSERASIRRAPSSAASSTATWSRTAGSSRTRRRGGGVGGPLPARRRPASVRILDGGTVVRPLLRQVAGLLELDDHAVLRPSSGASQRASGSIPKPRRRVRRRRRRRRACGLAAAVYGASEGLACS